GNIEQAISAFADWDVPQVKKFLAYLETHRLRIPDYHTYQSQGITIGSGAVESTIKQIGRRIKITGAQWNRRNLPQVLKHRCAYLNLAFNSL
ncbi:MAG: ISKra4 family transposase, partial [Pseudanabaena sp.]